MASISDISTQMLLRPLLETGLSVEINASGVSMFPLIIHGQSVRIEPVMGRAPRRNDIIAFERSDEKVVLHRVVWTSTNGRLVTRGDSCAAPDEEITIDKVLGFATSARWFFCRINLKSWPIIMYGKMVLALCPVSNAINRFSARCARLLNKIIRYNKHTK